MPSSITMSSIVKHITRLSGLGLLLKLSTFIKSSFIFGSHALFFSGVTMIMPLAGALGNPLDSVILFCMRLLLGGSFGWHLLALTVPGLCASLYWNVHHWSIRLLLPILCFVAFIAHPVGGAASLYALYWLIPICLYFKSDKSVFLTALASTFTAHAVGSVIWLYTVPMTASMWHALIPLVIIERLCFATGMTLGYHAINQIVAWTRQTANHVAQRYTRSLSV